MLYKLYNLPMKEKLILLFFLILLNISIDIFMYFSVSKRFNTTNSKSLSFTRLVRIIKYISNPVIFITIIYSTLITFSFSDNSTLLSYLLPYGFVGFVWIFLLIIRHIIKYSTSTKISNQSISKSKYIISIFSHYGLFIAPVLILLFFFYFFNKFNYDSIANYLIALTSFIAILLTITFTITNLILKKSFKSHLVTDTSLKADMEQILKNMGYPQINIVILKKDNPNFIKAAAAASKKGPIYLSSDILENLSLDEIGSVVAHEVGHIKYKHILKRSLAIFLGIILTQSLSIILSITFYWFEAGSIFIICMVFLAFYFTIIMSFISRSHERKSDKFVIKQGYSSETFKSALFKIENLMGQNLDLFEFEYIFLSHPSLKSRINNLKEFEDNL